jgi:hypothetical protein
VSDKPWFIEGLRRYRAGEQLKFSSDVAGDPTWGYGDLDTLGYWQYPVPYGELRQDHKDLISELIGRSR